MALPVVHVGFHKSGSTTLQNALFAHHPGVANLGEPVENLSALDAMRMTWNSCHRDPQQRRPFDLERAQDLWRQALASTKGRKVVVFSKERLTLYDYCSHPGDGCLPHKLRAVVGPARIVIVARHQIRLIESLYYAKTNGEVSPERWLQRQTQGPLNKERFHVYRYHAFAKAYSEAFGRENVGVFLLEDLAKNTDSFARRLCSFVGIDPDEGVRLLQGERLHGRTTRRGLTYAKLRKLWQPYIRFGKFVPAPIVTAFSQFIGRGQPLRVELPACWVAELESYYRDDNSRLAQDWDLPLERYEYPL
jgi:hypothetical protein